MIALGKVIDQVAIHEVCSCAARNVPTSMKVLNMIINIENKTSQICEQA